MYAKVFSQIFDSSIADDYQTRHVFMDLLVLADSKGTIDMTLSAIARRTNVPQDVVEKAIQVLLRPDEYSRTKDHEGRRLIPIDEARGWGWIIVNYCNYRELRDETMRREQNRNAQRRYKEKVSHGKPESSMVSHGKPESAHTEEEAEAEAEEKRDIVSSGKPKTQKREIKLADNSEWLNKIKEAYQPLGIDVDRELVKAKAWMLSPKGKGRKLTQQFFTSWLSKADATFSVASTHTPIKPSSLTQEEFANLNLWREVLPKMSAKAKTAEEIENVSKIKVRLQELEAKAAQ